MPEIRWDKKVSSKSWQTWLDCLSRDALRSQFSFWRASALDVAASRDFSVSSSLDSLASRFALKDWVSRKASDNWLAVDSSDLFASTFFAWKQARLPLQWPPSTWYLYFFNFQILYNKIKGYCSVLSKWEFFIKMRAALLAPILPRVMKEGESK